MSKYYINEVKVYLAIKGFECEHTEITKILEVEPNEIWKKGELISKPPCTLRCENNGWAYEIVRNDVIYVQEMIDEVIDIFRDKADNFKKLPKNSYIYLEIVPCLKKGMPSIAFSKRNIDFLYKIGAEIDFDMYGL